MKTNGFCFIKKKYCYKNVKTFDLLERLLILPTRFVDPALLGSNGDGGGGDGSDGANTRDRRRLIPEPRARARPPRAVTAARTLAYLYTHIVMYCKGSPKSYRRCDPFKKI